MSKNRLFELYSTLILQTGWSIEYVSGLNVFLVIELALSAETQALLKQIPRLPTMPVEQPQQTEPKTKVEVHGNIQKVTRTFDLGDLIKMAGEIK